METSTIIVFALIAVISIILILSVVHISSKIDELASHIRRIAEIMENNDKRI